MTPLAALNAPTRLASAFVQNGTIRLRVRLGETGGLGDASGIVMLQYSADLTTWTDVAAQTTSGGVPFLYVNGAATNGNLLGSFLLPAGHTLGRYHETAIGIESIAALETALEVDFAVKCHWPTTGTWYFRVVWDGVAVAPSAAGYPRVTISAFDRTHVVTSVGNHFGSEGLCEELRIGDYKRLWFDGNRYWFFYTVAGAATGSRLFYRHWTGSGEWSSPDSLPCSGITNDGRSRQWVESINGTHTVFVLLGTDDGITTRWLRRGTIAGTSISWDLEQPVTANFGDEANGIGVDDGDYVWLAGVVNNGGTVWARRATNPNSVSSFEPARTVADMGAPEGRACHVIGLGSNRALVLWYKTNATDVRYSIVSEPAGFGPVASVNLLGCHDQDWGFTVDKTNGFVYLVHTDSTANGAGNLVLRVFNIATETWSTATAPPGGVGNRPFGGDDHVAVQLIGNDLYAFFCVGDNGDDRAVAYHKYMGPGASGTWNPSATVLSGSGRCNLDRIITVGPGTPANRILAVVAAGDNPNQGSPIDLEWWGGPVGPSGAFSTFGEGCPGSGGRPRIDALPDEKPIVGQGLDLQFTSLPLTEFSPILAIIGFSNTVWPPLPLPLPLAVFGMTDCRLYVSFDFSGLLIGQNGECNWTIAIPNNPAVAGSQFYVQGLIADIGTNPAGVVVSNGGTVLVGTH
ncbi:MAG TPA: hypothetical protein VFD82_07005 [Planctomycetota bacterium]|nr:hypothetical protein [Planctomycetota bacterium]